MLLIWKDLFKKQKDIEHQHDLPDLELSKLSTDSRCIESQSWYLPLQGPRFDGHDFIKEALSKNISGFFCDKQKVEKIPTDCKVPFVIVDNTYRILTSLASIARDYFQGQVLAITGSNGKTTVKEMVANILSCESKTLRTLGNNNNNRQM